MWVYINISSFSKKKNFMRKQRLVLLSFWVFFFFFFWPVLRGLQDLSSQSGTELMPSAVNVWSPSHCTTRELPNQDSWGSCFQANESCLEERCRGSLFPCLPSESLGLGMRSVGWLPPACSLGLLPWIILFGAHSPFIPVLPCKSLLLRLTLPQTPTVQEPFVQPSPLPSLENSALGVPTFS